MRYLAAAGPREALERLAQDLRRPGVPNLSLALASPWLSVWAPPGTPVALGVDGRSVAVGLVFERASDEPVPALPAPLPTEEAFTARYWGAYVLLASQDAETHAVLRDPSGMVTAYHRRAGPLDLYASDAALLAVPAQAPIDPDTDFVRHWLTYPLLRGALSGWSGTSEIVPGTARRVTAAGPQVVEAWNPWDHAGADRRIDDPDEAARVLREAVLTAVPRLIGSAADPVVRLSGGLDSAIVAAALAHAGRPFRAVNFATLAPDGDERRYARLAARHWGIELAELVEEPAVPDFARTAPLALRPPANAVLQAFRGAIESHLAVTGADLVLGGTGGDNVFCYLGSASPVLDALHGRGLRAAAAAVADLAQLHGATAGSVMRAAYRRSQRPQTQWRRDVSFLAPGAATPEPPDHPWLQAPARALRGKREHVQSIVSVGHFIADPASGQTPAIVPLLAQPVLEACLRIPTWLWVRGGRDRAIARRAFADLLPGAIAARQSKGDLGTLVTGSYLAGRAQLEDLLPGGKLAVMGLLDRDAIHAYLRRSDEPDDAGFMRLLDMAAAETWLRAFDH